MKLKSKLIIIITTIIIYFGLNFVYVSLFKAENDTYAYILSQNVSSGEKVEEGKLKEIKIQGENIESINISDVKGMVYNLDYMPGTLLNNDMLMKEEEFSNLEDNNELLAINITNLDSSLITLVSKGAKVNVYASGKISQLESILNFEEFESYSNNSDNGFATIRVLDNVKIEKMSNLSDSSFSR
ncbi:MAG: hypothetical protein IJ809_04495 [Clostridia bacterium]|nr:hypothetical protein [Clostridia bacterium]